MNTENKQNTENIQIRKIGRQKKTESENISDNNIQIKKVGRPKKHEDRKEYLKQRYTVLKDKISENNKDLSKRYRESYKILVKMVEENMTIPDIIKDEVIKIVSI